VLGLGVAGFFAVGAIPSGGPTDRYVQVRATVTRLVRVREHGHLVVRQVRLVKRIYAQPVTVQLTHTLQEAGTTRVVSDDVVRYRPVYRSRVVKLAGKNVTVRQVVTDTRLLTVTNAQTQTRTDTQTQTVTQTVTQAQTVTLPRDTVTTTAPPLTTVIRATVTETETVQTTVTGPEPTAPAAPTTNGH
jgi:hypothetical protein